MTTIQQVTDYSEREPAAIFKFLDEALVSFAWIVMASFSGAVALSVVFSFAPPPIHPLGFILP